MVDKNKLTQAEQDTWEALTSENYIFPGKDATLRITPRCGEIGSVYLNPRNGEMFVYDGFKWRKMK